MASISVTSSPSSPRETGSTRTAHALAAAAIGLAMLAGMRVASAATITVDASKQTAGNPHFWSACFGTGKAKLALRGDWQTHYKLGNRELGAQRVRGHGLLNSNGSEMELYKGAGSYDWKNLDTYLLAITSAGMVPLIELDFMPTGLASSGDKSPPKDYTEWKNFIKALTQHLIDKYGMDEVKKWYFEVWNEPDYPGFWQSSSGTAYDMNAYYTLYDNTVDALTAVIPDVLVGGPSTTNAGPVSAFLAHVKSANKRVTFVSSHVYPGGAATGTSADAASLVSDNNSRVSAITSNGYSTANVKSFNTEWNSSYSGQGSQVGNATLSMDNHWNVGFILKGVKLMSDKNSGDTPAVEIFSYWALTDVFDEDGGTDGIHMTQKANTPFGYVFGLMTFQGMRKAAWNAFKMLNYLGPKRLQSGGGTGSDGIDAMATSSASGDSLEILVYNYYKTLSTASGSGESVTINVSNLPSALAGKEVFVTRFLADETHSNPYKIWEGQGKPTNTTEAQWREMRAAQHLAVVEAKKQTVDASFSTTFNLVKQAGTLIIVSAKRPLMGRNALVEIEGEDYDGQDKATKKDSGDSTLGQAISVTSGGYVYFENVDYTDGGVNAVQLRVKAGSDTSLELHAETQTGTLLGKCEVASTSNAWATKDCALSQTVTGVAKLYVVFGGAMELNWMKFQAGGNPPGTGGVGAGGSGGSAVGGAGGSAAGGAGGSAPGGAGGSARGGAGGSAPGGAGGSPAGGSGGGSARGGAGGGAGGSAAGGAGGSAAGGSGGSAAGSGGSAAGGSGGSAAGGSGGSAAGGAGGSAAGGAGGTAAGGSGGAPGSGGATAGGGEASGCSCRVGNGGEPSGTLLLLGLVGAVLGLRRQRARRCR